MCLPSPTLSTLASFHPIPKFPLLTLGVPLDRPLIFISMGILDIPFLLSDWAEVTLGSHIYQFIGLGICLFAVLLDIFFVLWFLWLIRPQPATRASAAVALRSLSPRR